MSLDYKGIAQKEADRIAEMVNEALASSEIVHRVEIARDEKARLIIKTTRRDPLDISHIGTALIKI